MNLNIVIFGAGGAGEQAYNYFSGQSVFCFADNFVSGSEYLGKPVISTNELRKIYHNSIIVIASFDYADEIETQLDEMGMKAHITFGRDFYWKEHSLFPYYVRGEWNGFSYRQLFGYLHLERRGAFSVYTTRERLVFLLLMLKAGRLLEQVDTISIPEQLSEKEKESLPASIVERITPLKDAVRKTNILLMDVPRSEDTNYRFLDDIDQSKIIYLSDYEQFVPTFQHPELKKFKDIHRGERCFVIGNGPSLSSKDLDRIKSAGDISFASNKIYKIFDKTSWRPSYYGISDSDVYGNNLDALRKLKLPFMFFSDGCLQNWYLKGTDSPVDGAYYFHEQLEKCDPNPTRMTTDLSRMTYGGVTALCDFSIPMACYMGFKTIYLLGVDNSSPVNSLFEKGSHFYDETLSEKELAFYQKIKCRVRPLQEDFERQRTAFQQVKREAEKLNVHIYNATRGGNLDVFERVDFDSLF